MVRTSKKKNKVSVPTVDIPSAAGSNETIMRRQKKIVKSEKNVGNKSNIGNVEIQQQHQQDKSPEQMNKLQNEQAKKCEPVTSEKKQKPIIYQSELNQRPRRQIQHKFIKTTRPAPPSRILSPAAPPTSVSGHPISSTSPQSSASLTIKPDSKVEESPSSKLHKVNNKNGIIVPKAQTINNAKITSNSSTSAISGSNNNLITTRKPLRNQTKILDATLSPISLPDSGCQIDEVNVSNNVSNNFTSNNKNSKLVISSEQKTIKSAKTKPNANKKNKSIITRLASSISSPTSFSENSLEKSVHNIDNNSNSNSDSNESVSQANQIITDEGSSSQDSSSLDINQIDNNSMDINNSSRDNDTTLANTNSNNSIIDKSEAEDCISYDKSNIITPSSIIYIENNETNCNLINNIANYETIESNLNTDDNSNTTSNSSSDTTYIQDESIKLQSSTIRTYSKVRKSNRLKNNQQNQNLLTDNSNSSSSSTNNDPIDERIEQKFTSNQLHDTVPFTIDSTNISIDLHTINIDANVEDDASRSSLINDNVAAISNDNQLIDSVIQTQSPIKNNNVLDEERLQCGLFESPVQSFTTHHNEKNESPNYFESKSLNCSELPVAKHDYGTSIRKRITRQSTTLHKSSDDFNKITAIVTSDLSKINEINEKQSIIDKSLNKSLDSFKKTFPKKNVISNTEIDSKTIDNSLASAILLSNHNDVKFQAGNRRSRRFLTDTTQQSEVLTKPVKTHKKKFEYFNKNRQTTIESLHSSIPSSEPSVSSTSVAASTTISSTLDSSTEHITKIEDITEILEKFDYVDENKKSSTPTESRQETIARDSPVQVSEESIEDKLAKIMMEPPNSPMELPQKAPPVITSSVSVIISPPISQDIIEDNLKEEIIIEQQKTTNVAELPSVDIQNHTEIKIEDQVENVNQFADSTKDDVDFMSRDTFENEIQQIVEKQFFNIASHYEESNENVHRSSSSKRRKKRKSKRKYLEDRPTTSDLEKMKVINLINEIMSNKHKIDDSSSNSVINDELLSDKDEMLESKSPEDDNYPVTDHKNMMDDVEDSISKIMSSINLEKSSSESVDVNRKLTATITTADSNNSNSATTTATTPTKLNDNVKMECGEPIWKKLSKAMTDTERPKYLEEGGLGNFKFQPLDYDTLFKPMPVASQQPGSFMQNMPDTFNYNAAIQVGNNIDDQISDQGKSQHNIEESDQCTQQKLNKQSSNIHELGSGSIVDNKNNKQEDAFVGKNAKRKQGLMIRRRSMRLSILYERSSQNNTSTDNNSASLESIVVTPEIKNKMQVETPVNDMLTTGNVEVPQIISNTSVQTIPNSDLDNSSSITNIFNVESNMGLSFDTINQHYVDNETFQDNQKYQLSDKFEQNHENLTNTFNKTLQQPNILEKPYTESEKYFSDRISSSSEKNFSNFDVTINNTEEMKFSYELQNNLEVVSQKVNNTFDNTIAKSTKSLVILTERLDLSNIDKYINVSNGQNSQIIDEITENVVSNFQNYYDDKDLNEVQVMSPTMTESETIIGIDNREDSSIIIDSKIKEEITDSVTSIFQNYVNETTSTMTKTIGGINEKEQFLCKDDIKLELPLSPSEFHMKELKISLERISSSEALPFIQCRKNEESDEYPVEKSIDSPENDLESRMGFKNDINNFNYFFNKNLREQHNLTIEQEQHSIYNKQYPIGKCDSIGHHSFTSSEQDIDIKEEQDQELDDDTQQYIDMDGDEEKNIRRSGRLKKIISESKERSHGFGLVKDRDRLQNLFHAEPYLNMQYMKPPSEYNSSIVSSLSMDENSTNDTFMEMYNVPSNELHSVYQVKPKTPEEIEIEQKHRETALSLFQPILDSEYKSERVISKEAKKMTCDCFLTTSEIERGEFGCGEDCLNRLLMIECGTRCVVSERCTNKRFQKHQYSDCTVFYAGKKGFGIRAVSIIEPGEFIMEYVGEVLNGRQFEQRADEYSKDKSRHHYFMALRSDCIIDATVKGNISRFINHSCDPNAETQKWTVNGELRIGFFSTRRILPEEEITFDYQFQRYGKEAQKCYCEAENCRGWIGEEPDSDEDDDEDDDDYDKDGEDDDDDFDRNIIQTIDLTSEELQNEEQENLEKLDKQLPPKKRNRKLFQIEDDEIDDHGKEVDKIGNENNLVIDNQEDDKSGILIDGYEKESISLMDDRDENKKLIRASRKKQKIDAKLMKAYKRSEALQDAAFDKEIESLKRTKLKNQAHTLQLCRLMVRAKQQITRNELIYILRTGELTCRRLFLDYHGLKLLYTYMCDSIHSDLKEEMSFKLELLNTLESLPIPNKTMLNDSKVMATVQKWGQTEIDYKQLNIKLSPSLSVGSTTPEEIVDPFSSPKIEDQSTTVTIPKPSSPPKTIKNTLIDDDNEKLIEIIENICKLSATLIEQWEMLPEVFRIPKKQRIEQMKEHEREADRNYKTLGIKEDEQKQLTSERFKKKNKTINKKWDRSENDTQAHLTKLERRQLFEAKVAKEEDNRKRQENQMAHQAKCQFFRLNPCTTRPDQMPFGVDAISGQWYSVHNVPILAPPSHAHIIPPNIPKSTNPDDYTLPPMDLPELWKYAIDEYGHIFYYHNKIRISQWEPPIKLLPLTKEEEEEQQAGQAIPVNITTGPIHCNNQPKEEVKKKQKQKKVQVYRIPTIESMRTVYREKSETESSETDSCDSSEEELKAKLLEANLAKRRNDAIKKVLALPPPNLDEEISALAVTNNEDNGSANSLNQHLTDEEAIKREEKRIRRQGLVEERIISPRSDAERYELKLENRRCRENREKLKRRKEELKRRGASLDKPTSAAVTAKKLSKLTDGLPVVPNITNDNDDNYVKDADNEYDTDESDSEVTIDSNLYKKISTSGNIVDELDVLKKEKLAARKLKMERLQKKQRVIAAATSAISSGTTAKHKIIKVKRKRLAVEPTSTYHVNTDGARRIKDKFRSDIAGVIVQHLGPFRKESCRIGRITNNEDFKHLARKLTHFVMVKELKHCDNTLNVLEVTDSVKNKAREFIKKYMSKFGDIYIKPENEPEYKDFAH